MATKKATKTAARKSPAQAVKAPAKKSAASNTAQTAAPKASPTHEEIALHALHLWNERGPPHDSPHIDWHNAEQQLKG